MNTISYTHPAVYKPNIQSVTENLTDKITFDLINICFSFFLCIICSHLHFKYNIEKKMLFFNTENRKIFEKI